MADGVAGSDGFWLVVQFGGIETQPCVCSQIRHKLIAA